MKLGIALPCSTVAVVLGFGCNALIGFDDDYVAVGDAGGLDAATDVEAAAPDARDATEAGDEKPTPDTDARAPFASCLRLARDCGPDGGNDCCATSRVPGGTFNRLNDPAARATVSPFDLDVYEVTVGRYKAFVERGWATQVSPPPEGTGSHPRISGSGWKSEWNKALPRDAGQASTFFGYSTFSLGTPTRPINSITWYQAFAFCAWDGGRLPTLAESSFAATGGDEQRYYPWSYPPESVTIDATYASYKEDAPRSCNGDGLDGCAVTDLMPVGIRPKGNGRWGHADLAGNVGEWVVDGHLNTLITHCNDCMQPWVDLRTNINSGYNEVAYGQRNEVMTGNDPTDEAHWVGVRCARSLR